MKYAAITLDVEDWYHTGYLMKQNCDRKFSILDVLDPFAKVLDQYNAKATFFVLGELIPTLAPRLNELAKNGHEIATHGWGHVRPIDMSAAEFSVEIARCQKIHQQHIKAPLQGFRAALFGIDRERLNQVKDAGFLYDSSSSSRDRRFQSLDIAGFEPVRSQIYRQKDFFEFQVGAPGLKSFFVNGGGGTRIMPWTLTMGLLKRSLAKSDYFNFYTHPLDISKHPLPLPTSIPWLQKMRLLHGRESMMDKFRKILDTINQQNYQFSTLSEIRKSLV